MLTKVMLDDSADEVVKVGAAVPVFAVGGDLCGWWKKNRNLVLTVLNSAGMFAAWIPPIAAIVTVAKSMAAGMDTVCPQDAP